jgi:hypothetical protein
MDTLLGILQPGDEAIVRASGRTVTLVGRVRNQPWVWLVEYPSGTRRRFRAWELEQAPEEPEPPEPEGGYLGIYGVLRCSNDVRERGVLLPFGPADSQRIRDRYARWLDADGEDKEDLGWELAAIWADLFVRERGSKAGCEFETVGDIWLE